jgi:hypothetical protein
MPTSKTRLRNEEGKENETNCELNFKKAIQHFLIEGK